MFPVAYNCLPFRSSIKPFNIYPIFVGMCQQPEAAKAMTHWLGSSFMQELGQLRYDPALRQSGAVVRVGSETTARNHGGFKAASKVAWSRTRSREGRVRRTLARGWGECEKIQAGGLVVSCSPQRRLSLPDQKGRSRMRREAPGDPAGGLGSPARGAWRCCGASGAPDGSLAGNERVGCLAARLGGAAGGDPG